MQQMGWGVACGGRQAVVTAPGPGFSGFAEVEEAHVLPGSSEIVADGEGQGPPGTQRQQSWPFPGLMQGLGTGQLGKFIGQRVRLHLGTLKGPGLVICGRAESWREGRSPESRLCVQRP